MQENLVVEICPTQPSTYLELGFNLLGHYPSMDLKRGQNFITLELDTGEACWKEWKAQERVLKLDIHIEYTLFKSLIFAHLDKLPTKFRDIIALLYKYLGWVLLTAILHNSRAWKEERVYFVDYTLWGDVIGAPIANSLVLEQLPSLLLSKSLT
ncbi:hypothetical protein [Anabaena sp. UHCC 0399]|uniref:hypothetical protein n=1 Tax=Anabaena sp. UHCC 0399 TaxID=3110238 RepID=UPI002B2072FD|nr:hypothetical protein [Anabaena sp. UHCC 0399]MEA5566047.1 hypothetical protein [Anabaena sp. UHCC 0399]